MEKKCLDCGGEFNGSVELILKTDIEEKLPGVVCKVCGLVQHRDNKIIITDKNGLRLYLLYAAFDEDILFEEEIEEERESTPPKQILH